MHSLSIASLLFVADAYRQHAGMSPSRLATILFNDGKALTRISAGGDLNTRSWERAMAWFSANWPERLAWPEGVERPQAATGGDQRPQAVTGSGLPLTPTLSPAGRGGDAAEVAP